MEIIFHVFTKNKNSHKWKEKVAERKIARKNLKIALLLCHEGLDCVLIIRLSTFLSRIKSRPAEVVAMPFKAIFGHWPWSLAPSSLKEQDLHPVLLIGGITSLTMWRTWSAIIYSLKYAGPCFAILNSIWN